MRSGCSEDSCLPSCVQTRLGSTRRPRARGRDARRNDTRRRVPPGCIVCPGSGSGIPAAGSTSGNAAGIAMETQLGRLHRRRFHVKHLRVRSDRPADGIRSIVRPRGKRVSVASDTVLRNGVRAWEQTDDGELFEQSVRPEVRVPSETRRVRPKTRAVSRETPRGLPVSAGPEVLGRMTGA